MFPVDVCGYALVVPDAADWGPRFHLINEPEMQ